MWKDLDFDPAQHAFYDDRVIEITMLRWTAYDAYHFEVKQLEGARMAITERA